MTVKKSAIPGTWLFAAMFAPMIWMGCSKSSTHSSMGPPPTTPAPTISSFAPDSGVFNTTVVIAGTNFSTTAGDNTVTFNGLAASVSAATATQLTVTVPKGAGTGTVKVTVGGQTATGPDFYYVITYTVSTLAGSTAGYLDGTGTGAKFNTPFDIAVDSSGNVIVADAFNVKIRMITPAGVVTTIAGSTQGFLDGPVGSAQFSIVSGVKVDANNNIYVADPYNYKVREISGGTVTTLAGTTGGEKDGAVDSAQFDSPTKLAIDATGKVYVCDAHYVRVISSGNVSTLYDGHNYTSTLVAFTSVATGQNNDLFLLDDFGANVFNLTTAGTFTVFAGNGIIGYQDGSPATASFSSAEGLALDAKGNVLVADAANQRIRMVSPSGQVSTIAGTGTAGDVDGPAATSEFFNPRGIAVDKKTGTIYVVEDMRHRIRKIVGE